MVHVLDNPVWSALTTGNANLANGSGAIRYFDKEVSPFVALEDNTGENLATLYDIMPHDRPVLLLRQEPMQVPAQWKLLNYVHGLQMVHDNAVALPDVELDLQPLTNAHVPQMMDLTKLTNPGPFAVRTIDFGHYYGVFNGDELVAMAGQRMHPADYAEISAVCTHPEYLGKGYARQLLLHHIHRIKAAAETPFLHVRKDNERAVKVYESLGFKTRQEVYFYALMK